MKPEFFVDVVAGPPCPFTRDHTTNSHPKAAMETIGERRVLICRHCNAELALQPGLPLIQEPYESDPRVRIAE